MSARCIFVFALCIEANLVKRKLLKLVLLESEGFLFFISSFLFS
jgi:hypothetical protein